jgi:NAD(P)-dependent dehydrogenase (short-subunit alcohol dehydrogenase family)
MGVAVVTGADRGLGAALATALAARGDEVWAACLAETPELSAPGLNVVGGIDVSSDESVAKLRDALGDRQLDLVLSNAGINEASGGPWDANTTSMVHELNVNALGAVRVVRTLLPLLAPGAKIAMVSTGRGAATRDPVPAHAMNYGYRISKAALNMYGKLLSQDLRPHGFAVVLLNPGPINSDLMRRMVASGGTDLDLATIPSPEEVAPGVIAVIDGLTMASSGRWLELGGTETDG